MNGARWGRRAFWAVAAVACLSACASSETSRFYTLSSLADWPSEPRSQATRPLAIGIGTVALPSYLDRPQVVRRTDANEFAIAEFDKWAAPLEDIFPQVLAENLSVLLATDDVFVLPRRRSRDLDCEVNVEVNRFDADASGRAVLSARWEIFGKDAGKLVRDGTTTVTEVATGRSNEAAVAAMSQTVADLSRDIAAAIQSLSLAK